MTLPLPHRLPTVTSLQPRCSCYAPLRPLSVTPSVTSSVTKNALSRAGLLARAAEPHQLHQLYLSNRLQTGSPVTTSQVYHRVLQSPDYQLLLRAEEPCACGSGEPTKKCHMLDMDGVLARFAHPDGEPCKSCPACIGLPAITNLLNVSNHLEVSENQLPKC